MARLDKGDAVGGMLEMLKGTAQVSAGVGGVGTAAVGLFGGLSLVAAPFALILGLGTLAVVVVEASIYARAGSENRVQPLIDRVETAKRSEFHLNARGHLTQSAPPVPRLRQRIGVLNQILKRERFA